MYKYVFIFFFHRLIGWNEGKPLHVSSSTGVLRGTLSLRQRCGSSRHMEVYLYSFMRQFVRKTSQNYIYN